MATVKEENTYWKRTGKGSSFICSVLAAEDQQGSQLQSL